VYKYVKALAYRTSYSMLIGHTYKVTCIGLCKINALGWLS